MSEIDLSNHPKTERGNFLCTPVRPMPAGAEGRWEHEGAREIADYGDTVGMECRDCGKYWTQELPQ